MFEYDPSGRVDIGDTPIHSDDEGGEIGDVDDGVIATVDVEIGSDSSDESDDENDSVKFDFSDAYLRNLTTTDWDVYDVQTAVIGATPDVTEEE